MESVAAWLDGLRRFVRQVGPLLLIEVLLPGGTLLALLLFLCRSGRLRFGERATAMMTLLPAQVRMVRSCKGKYASIFNPIS